MFRSIIPILVLVPTLLSLTPCAQAGFILDDFDDPARIELPGGPERVVTPGVGDLNAERTLRFRLIGSGDPISLADVGVGVPGRYQARLVGDTFSGTLFIHADYTNFANADFTQGGGNDALFLDFIAAPEGPPPSITVVAIDVANNYLVRRFSTLDVAFPLGPLPDSIVLPFETFTDRGGGQIPADFSAIRELQVWFGSGSGFAPWEVTLDGIRVGRVEAIPEPNSLVLAITLSITCLVGGWCFRSTGTRF